MKADSSAPDTPQSYRWWFGFGLFVVLVLLFQSAMAYLVGLDASLSGDEKHFVATIRQFGQGLSIHLLRTYEEMSTPLPFLLFSGWGRLFGFDIVSLRLGSLLVAVLTYITWFGLLGSVLRSGWRVWFGAWLLVLNPYMIYLSIFVHTDTITILFVLLAVLAWRFDRPWMMALALAAAMLCRQYVVYVAGAAALNAIVGWLGTRERSQAITSIASIASVVPLLILFIFWGGAKPDNELQKLYMPYAFVFHPTSLVLYISVLGLYLLPVTLTVWGRVYGQWKVVAGAAIVSFVYWLFPVKASAPSIEQINVHTVGLLHKALRWMGGEGWPEQMVFYAGFLLGLPIIWLLVVDGLKQARAGQGALRLFLNLSGVLFLLVMPWSYLHWEKYILPVYPLMILRILMLKPHSLNQDQPDRPSENRLDATQTTPGG